MVASADATLSDVSASGLPDIDFYQIRPYGSPASRANAFEELASILVRTGLVEWPEGVTFERFGNPDGGREGKGTLPNGDVWAWQAKYLFAFDDGEISQVNKSVARVLDREPNLKRYFIALPYDLPAGDTDGPKRKLKSAHTKWLEKKAEWEALAKAKGMNVEFGYVGVHDLVSELTDAKNAGRVRYWFNASVLSPDALHQRLQDVINSAGPRYTPELHVEVEAVQALEGLGRSPQYVRQVQLALAALRKARASNWRPPKGDRNKLKAKVKAAVDELIAAEVAVESFLDAARGTGPLPDISGSFEPAEESLSAVDEVLFKKYLGEKRYGKGASTDQSGSERVVEQAGWLHRDVSAAFDAIRAVQYLLHSSETRAAKSGRLLMTGRAGVGKTHLFCDVAASRISAGLPTLVVLGQNLESGNLLPQIGSLVDLVGSVDEVLGVLDAAGEAAGALAMLMLDALNEGANPERWADNLRVLAGAVDRHPHVVLAVSCRTEFLSEVVGEAAGFARVEHYGFAEATSEAVDRYTRQYNLERLHFPVLNPEFGNPLFLKLACEALSTLGETRFDPGTAGMVAVCNAYVDAVNLRLAAPTRCDFDAATNPVRAVVRELAALGPGPYDRAEATRIADAAVPGKSWSKSLLNGLLREGVLMQSRASALMFSYQRLGDVTRALTIVELAPDEVRTWYRNPDRDRWAELGTLGALAVLIPERFGEEVIDLLKDDEGRVDSDILDAFVESIVLRAPQHTTDRTAEIVEKLLGMEQWASDTWEMLMRVACVPSHRLNAEWLHEHLMPMALTDRDTTWSDWLIGGGRVGSENATSVLLDWAWHPVTGIASTDAVPTEVSRLATFALGWMFATPDRRVRDRATKALVATGERGADGFAPAVSAFSGCNDPYVVERLAGSLCGVALRTGDADVLKALADAAVELVADGWPEHLLTRDYLKRVSQRAREAGWDGPEWLPPYGAAWPVKMLAPNTIEKMVKAPGYKYSTIWHSLDPQWGDFGKYVVESSLDYFKTSDRKKLKKQARRAIFTGVVELGWTPEVFDSLEQRRQPGRDGPVERYGKKYQWIGYYEVLGRLADHHELTERWSKGGKAFAYEQPEQIAYRDIDPTVLTPGGVEDPEEGQLRWFAPVEAEFAPTVSDYPQELDGVPDPLDLIALSGPDGEQWLSLIRHASWTQVLPPEVAALKAPNMNVWMQIRGYLVPTAEVKELRAWAVGRDWDGRWMSENADVHSCLLGAHPDSPDWDWANGDAEPRSTREGEPPTVLFQPIAWYGGTGTSREEVGTKEPTGYVPSRMLYELLEMNRGKDFQWTNPQGLAAWDPTAGMDEAATLVLRRELVQRLKEQGYTLFWTVLLNKLRHDRDFGRPGRKYRWLSASASYVMKGDDVELVSTYAARLRPGGQTKPSPVAWSLRMSG